MPTPLDNIKNGIKKQDWKLVDKGYKGLTGESALGEVVKPTKPTKKSVKSPPKKRIVKQAKVEPEDNEVTEIVQDYDGVIELSGQRQKKAATLEKLQINKKNKFVDNGRDCLDDKEFDSKVIATRTARRPPIGKTILTCDECGRTYNVPNDQIYTVGSYVCPPCMKAKYSGR